MRSTRKAVIPGAGQCKAGVYLWTVHSSDGFIVEYVGQTGESFAKRTKDHMIQTFGGNYRVCDPQLMHQGQVKVVWPGLWRKGTKDKMPEFAQRYLELAPVIQRYLEAVELFLAPITGDRRLLERIEGAIAHQIREQSPPAASLLPLDIRYRPRTQGEVPLSVNIECDQVVLGIPSHLVT